MRVHGFRSSFADWCAEQASPEFTTEEREMAMSHPVGNAVVASYLRTAMFDRRGRWLRSGRPIVPVGAEVIDLANVRPA